MPSSVTLEPDLDFDLEEELQDDEHAHAIPFCYEHRTQEFFPVSGTIAQVLCGRIIRINKVNEVKEKCEDCVAFHGKTNCYYCGKEIWG